MALSAEDFMKGEIAPDHLDADAFLKGEEIPQTPKKEAASIFEEDGLGNKRQWGLDPADREAAYGHGVLPDMAVSAADLGLRALQGVSVGVEAVGGGLNYLSDQTGLADLPAKLGIDELMGNKGGRFLPGNAMMALGEALPAFGAEYGMTPRVPIRPRALTEDLLARGTADEIAEAASKAGEKVNLEEVHNYVKTRDAGGQVGGAVYHQADLPLDEQHNLPFERPTQGEADLKAEADAFMAGKPAEPDLDYRQRDLPLEQPPQQLGLDLPEPTPKDIHPDIPQETPKGVQTVVDHVNETAADWKNAPQVEVHPDFSKLDNVDPNALGVYDADSGQIRLNTKAIEEEAAYRGLGVKEMTNTVLFHEGLGHFGLSQKFRTGLDDVLDKFYNDDESFRGVVKDWMKENPEAYSDHPNRVVRASEEVLAIMSEDGQIPTTVLNKTKNFIKATARKMGINLNYSRREIETILAQAHEKVVKGTGVDAEGQGLRYSANRTLSNDDPDVQAVAHQYGYDEERTKKALNEVDFKYAVDQTRRQRLGLENDGIKIETPQDDIDWVNKTHALNQSRETPFKEIRQSEDGTKFLEYKSRSGDVIPIKMAIDNGTAEIAIDQFANKANRLGPGELRQAMLKLSEAYPEIEQFGGYRRSGAGAGRVQEISVRQQKVMNNVNRYMKGSDKKSLSSERLNIKGDEGLGEDLMNFLKEKQDDVRQVVSDPEINRKVRDMGLTASTYVKGKTLADQNVAATLDAARNILVNSKQKLVTLGSKANETGMTPSIYAQMTEELAKAKAVYARLDEDTAELGRSMRILQRAKSSKASVASALKFMKEHEGSDGLLTDPKDMMELVDKLQRTGNELTPEAQTKLIKDSITPSWSDHLASVLNIPRTIKSSFDFSAPFRQGLPLFHTKEFWNAWGSMFKSFGSEHAFDKVLRDITSDPNYPLMQKSGVYIASRGGRLLGGEEAFMSKLATNLPGVKHSERAYTAFLDKLRADTFNRLLNEANKGRTTPLNFKDGEGNFVLTEGAKQELKDIGTFINSATGRGPLGRFENAAPWLSAVFWSPRLFASRLNLLAKPMMPSTYTKLSPVVRKEYLKSFLAVGGMAAAVTTLAKNLGADVEDNPVSADFNKIKIGNTRYDILGGEGQLLTLAARLASNRTKSAKGEVKELGKKFGDRDLDDIIIKFIRSKSAPIPGYIWDKRAGKNVVGEDAYRKTRVPLLDKDIDTETLELFMPMIASDIIDLKKDRGTPLLSPDSLEALSPVFGFGMQTYDVNKKRAKSTPVTPIPSDVSADDFMKGQAVQ